MRCHSMLAHIQPIDHRHSFSSRTFRQVTPYATKQKLRVLSRGKGGGQLLPVRQTGRQTGIQSGNDTIAIYL